MLQRPSDQVSTNTAL